MEHKAIQNDLDTVRAKGFNPIGFIPGVRGEGGKINPQVTQFALGNNKYVSVFHVKPVYYETKWNTWRPLEEVCSYHGNRKIILNSLATELMHPRFLAWLESRQKLIRAGAGYDRGTLAFESLYDLSEVRLHQLV